jgi:hypothetical protein
MHVHVYIAYTRIGGWRNERTLFVSSLADPVDPLALAVGFDVRRQDGGVRHRVVVEHFQVVIILPLLVFAAVVQVREAFPLRNNFKTTTIKSLQF